MKLLIKDRCPSAQGIDGRGGDDGRDIIWHSPQGLVIFEVKSHTARLTKGQKRKITGSLTKAARHGPARWELILPLDPSPSEESWFNKLRSQHSDITLVWHGQDWLDLQFARRPELRRYVEGAKSELLQRAMEYRQEEDVLARGLTDVASRLGRLDRHAQELSPYWRVDMATQPGTQILTISPRLPDAATLDPIVFSPELSFPRYDPLAAETAKRLCRALGYGGSVAVHGRYVERVTVDASEDTRRHLDADRHEQPGAIERLELSGAIHNEGLPLPHTLAVETEAGHVLTSIDLQMNQRTCGSRGVTLTSTDATDILRTHQLIDHATDGRRPQTFTLELQIQSPVNRWPWAVRPIAEFLLAFASGARVRMRLGVADVGHTDLAEHPTAEVFTSIAELIISLDEVQKHTKTPFPIPETLTHTDFLELQMLRELFTTGRAQWPDRHFTMGVRRDRRTEFLDTVGDGGALRVRFDSMGFVYGEHRICTGPVQLYAPHMQLTNRDELEAATGGKTDLQAQWKCTDGAGIHISRTSDAIEAA